MSSPFSAIAYLRIALRGMERDLGLDDLSDTELDALSAASELCEKKGAFKSSELFAHALMENVPRASQYRALRALEGKGMFVRGSAKDKRVFHLNTPT